MREEKYVNSHSHFHISLVLSFLIPVFSPQSRKGIFQPDSQSVLAFWLLNCPPRLQTSRRPSLTCAQICTLMFLFLHFVLLASGFLTFLLLLFSQTANFKATKGYLCAPGDFLPFEVLMEQSFETCLKRQRATFYVMTFINFASKWCC